MATLFNYRLKVLSLEVLKTILELIYSEVYVTSSHAEMNTTQSNFFKPYIALVEI